MLQTQGDELRPQLSSATDSQIFSLEYYLRNLELLLLIKIAWSPRLQEYIDHLNIIHWVNLQPHNLTFSFRQDLVISWENFDHKKLASLCGQLRDWKVWRSCEEKVWSYLLLHCLMLGHFVFYQEKPRIIMFCWALLVYNETTVIYSRWYLLVLLLLPELVKERKNNRRWYHV